MADPTANVCRLCFSVVYKFQFLSSIQQDMIAILFPELDIGICSSIAICEECEKTLEKHFNFKSTCLEIDDSIHNYINDKAKQVDLEKIMGLKGMKQTPDHLGRLPKICRTCLELTKPNDIIELIENDSSMLLEILSTCFPEIDITCTINPIICKNCSDLVDEYYNFFNKCMENETKIKLYLENNSTQDLNLFNLINNSSEQEFVKDLDVTVKKRIEDKIEKSNELSDSISKNENLNNSFCHERLNCLSNVNSSTENSSNSQGNDVIDLVPENGKLINCSSVKILDIGITNKDIDIEGSIEDTPSLKSSGSAQEIDIGNFVTGNELNSSSENSLDSDINLINHDHTSYADILASTVSNNCPEEHPANSTTDNNKNISSDILNDEIELLESQDVCSPTNSDGNLSICQTDNDTSNQSSNEKGQKRQLSILSEDIHDVEPISDLDFDIGENLGENNSPYNTRKKRLKQIIDDGSNDDNDDFRNDPDFEISANDQVEDPDDIDFESSEQGQKSEDIDNDDLINDPDFDIGENLEENNSPYNTRKKRLKQIIDEGGNDDNDDFRNDPDFEISTNDPVEDPDDIDFESIKKKRIKCRWCFIPLASSYIKKHMRICQKKPYFKRGPQYHCFFCTFEHSNKTVFDKHLNYCTAYKSNKMTNRAKTKDVFCYCKYCGTLQHNAKQFADHLKSCNAFVGDKQKLVLENNSADLNNSSEHEIQLVDSELEITKKVKNAIKSKLNLNQLNSQPKILPVSLNLQQPKCSLSQVQTQGSAGVKQLFYIPDPSVAPKISISQQQLNNIQSVPSNSVFININNLAQIQNRNVCSNNQQIEIKTKPSKESLYPKDIKILSNVTIKNSGVNSQCSNNIEYSPVQIQNTNEPQIAGSRFSTSNLLRVENILQKLKKSNNKEPSNTDIKNTISINQNHSKSNNTEHLVKITSTLPTEMQNTTISVKTSGLSTSSIFSSEKIRNKLPVKNNFKKQDSSRTEVTIPKININKNSSNVNASCLLNSALTTSAVPSKIVKQKEVNLEKYFSDRLKTVSPIGTNLKENKLNKCILEPRGNNISNTNLKENKLNENILEPCGNNISNKDKDVTNKCTSSKVNILCSNEINQSEQVLANSEKNKLSTLNLGEISSKMLLVKKDSTENNDCRNTEKTALYCLLTDKEKPNNNKNNINKVNSNKNLPEVSKNTTTLNESSAKNDMNQQVMTSSYKNTTNLNLSLNNVSSDKNDTNQQIVATPSSSKLTEISNEVTIVQDNIEIIDLSDDSDNHNSSNIGVRVRRQFLGVFKCDNCSFNTRKKKIVENHILIHLQAFRINDMFRCIYCGTFFTSVQALFHHMKSVHIVYNYTLYYWCVTCSTLFKTEEMLKTHKCLHKDKVITMFKSNGIAFCMRCNFENEDNATAKMHMKLCESRSTLLNSESEIVEIDDD